jgi:hypothetical protein
LNYFRIWIPNFSLIAKPLYDAAKGALREPLLAPSFFSPNFAALKKVLGHASSFYLPDVTKPFFLYIHSDKGQALGLLCQKAGDTPHPIAYLSKQLDPVFQGWPQCL